jgi:hypothetical protein
MFLDVLPFALTLAMAGQAAPPPQAPPAPVVPAQTIAAPAQTVRPPATPPKTYKEDAVAKTQIADAITAAATDDIRVLINWGANDDERCKAFIAAQRSREVAGTFFSDEYKQAYVDVGHLDKNLDVAKMYGVKLEAGALPALTVLDQNGKVLANISSRDLASADATGFDAKKISAFLTTYKAPAPDAIAPFEAAVKQAKRDGKTVMVWFSAPW